MGQLEDLRASLVGLSDDDILAMVRETRANRRISKRKTTKKASSKRPKQSIEEMLLKMTDSERIAFLVKARERLAAGGKK